MCRYRVRIPTGNRFLPSPHPPMPELGSGIPDPSSAGFYSYSSLSMPLTHSPLSHAPNATSVLQTWLNPISFLKPAPGSPRKGTQSGNPNPMMLQDRQASSGHLPVSEWAKRCVKCLPGQFNFRLEDRFPKEDVVYSHFVNCPGTVYSGALATPAATGSKECSRVLMP